MSKKFLKTFIIGIFIITGCGGNDDTPIPSDNNNTVTPLPELTFEINTITATMSGEIGSDVEEIITSLIDTVADLQWIVMQDVTGSTDDKATMNAGRIIRENGININIPADGIVDGGAVHFFIGGLKRTIAPGGQINVRSWNYNGSQGKDLPTSSLSHKPYKNYYDDMFIPQDFYWLQLETDHSDTHLVTEAEIDTFNLVTN